jgi:2-iminobutanoate/2-iminopropanoate deaminase
MNREAILTAKAPKAIGPYSQGITARFEDNGVSFIFASGQIPVDPKTAKIVEGGIAEQTRRCIQNLSAVLESAGSSCAKVVKTTVFLKDMADFEAMNTVYAEYFGTQPPARSTIAVSGLPLGSLIEIEAIALSEI